MSGPIEELYFNWLCAKVLPQHSSNYYGLLNVLHRTEFAWTVLGDKNRAADGVELRADFLRETNYLPERFWLESPCSVLECLYAFAKKAEFQTDIPAQRWFWVMMTNLGLEEYRHISDADVPVIQDILHTFIWRAYRENGEGGLFPMRSPRYNQREVEIWYQFCEWVEDQGLI